MIGNLLKKFVKRIGTGKPPVKLWLFGGGE